jgi:hypothetical protein
MRTFLLPVTALVMLGLPGSIGAETPQGIVAHTIGTYTKDFSCARNGCVGDVITCPAGEALVTAKITYLYMEGVCDDAGPTPCNGRLRGLLQDCLNPGRDLNVRAGMMSLTMTGNFRFCFDDTAKGDCTGNPPPGQIVGAGVNRMQSRVLLGGRVPISSSDELIMSDAPTFTIDGKEVRIDTPLTIYDATMQPDTLGSNCGGGGCGFAGTAVMGR